MYLKYVHIWALLKTFFWNFFGGGAEASSAYFHEPATGSNGNERKPHRGIVVGPCPGDVSVVDRAHGHVKRARVSNSGNGVQKLSSLNPSVLGHWNGEKKEHPLSFSRNPRGFPAIWRRPNVLFAISSGWYVGLYRAKTTRRTCQT